MKFRTAVGLLTPRQGEGANPVVTNAEEDSAARPSEPRILIADACTSGPRHNAIVIQSFTFKSCVCKHTHRQRTATDSQWFCTYSSVCPSDRLGVVEDDSTSRGARLAQQTIMTAWCLSFTRRASTAKAWGLRLQVSSPQKRHIGESVRWQSNCHFGVQTQPQRNSRRLIFLLWRFLGAVQCFEEGYLVLGKW